MAALQPMPTGTGVNQFAMPLPDVPAGDKCQGNVLPRTGTWVCDSLRDQCIKCSLVKMSALRLVHHRPVGVKAAGRELLKDDPVRAGHAAGCVDIFNAHQPLAAMCACIKPAGECCNQ